jgi:tetratricopeptide (TPR) repeat protein
MEEIAELEKKIAKEQSLLAQYEQQESQEDDPRRRMRIQANIEECKDLIFTYQTGIAQIRTASLSTQPSALSTPSLLLANSPYGLDGNLIGRKDELLLLDDWFHHDKEHPFLAVIGLGGMGKSALTWHWMQRLIHQGQAPRLVVWWSFYETEGTLNNLMGELLTQFGDDPRQFVSLRAAVNRMTYHLQQTPALLILDGAERLLRAYSNLGAAYQADALESGLAYQEARQCTDPVTAILLQWLAQPNITQAQTLLTSRLFPQDLTGRAGTMLTGVRRHDLTGLNPDEALRLFQEQNITTTRAEVIQVCEPLGYHPLSLRLLAGYAANSPTNPGDLQAAANYDPTADLLGKRQHILSQAYDSLPPTARETLSRLAAFRGSVAWDTLAAIFGDSQATRTALTLLEARGLLQRTLITTHHAPRTPALSHVEGTPHASRITHYDLHPIVRRYAYARLTDAAGVHAQLVSHFEAVPEPEKVQTLADLQPTIELYHHLARAGKYDEARVLYRDRLVSTLYFQLGAYQQAIELLRVLFPDGEDKLPRFRDEGAQAWTLNELANSYSLSGRPAAAAPIFQLATDMAEKQGNKKNLAIGLGNLAGQQMVLGQLSAAATNLRRRIDLCREIEDRFREAIGHQELGRVLAYTGDEVDAAAALDIALEQAKAEKHIQLQSVTWLYGALTALLRGDAAAGQSAAQEALRLAEEDARTSYPVERDYVRAYWLLGWAALAGGQLDTAQTHLDEALRRCRAINDVADEPSILLAQARLARALALSPQPAAGLTQALTLAHTLAEEAHRIAERAGYRLNLADIHNFLAHLALDSHDRPLARSHAQLAYDYALCDGPPYAYQSALAEAERLLRLV